MGGTFDKVGVDASGNVYTIGLASGLPSDLFIAKYDKSGNKLWAKMLDNGTGNSERFTAGVKVDSSGNIYAAGWTQSVGMGGMDFLLVKFDSNANILWQKYLGTSTTDNPYGLALDNSGNCYVGGYSVASGNGVPLLVKYDSSGNLVWQKNLSATTEIQGVALDSSGNIYAALGNGLLKFNSSGAIIWQRQYNNPTWVGFQGVAVDSTGAAYLVGRMYRPGTTYDCVPVVKYDASGNLAWQTYFYTADNYGISGHSIEIFQNVVDESS